MNPAAPWYIPGFFESAHKDCNGYLGRDNLPELSAAVVELYRVLYQHKVPLGTEGPSGTPRKCLYGADTHKADLRCFVEHLRAHFAVHDNIPRGVQIVLSWSIKQLLANKHWCEDTVVTKLMDPNIAAPATVEDLRYLAKMFASHPEAVAQARVKRFGTDDELSKEELLEMPADELRSYLAAFGLKEMTQKRPSLNRNGKVNHQLWLTQEPCAKRVKE